MTDALHLGLSVIAALVLLPAAATAAHLTLLTGASVFYRPSHPGQPSRRLRFCIVVGAHNAQEALVTTLEALNAARRADDRVIVVADGCTDDTAAIAERLGALVLRRPSTRFASRAAARQSGVDFALAHEWDALLMLDADSRIAPGFFEACEQAFASGAAAINPHTVVDAAGGWSHQMAVMSMAIHGVMAPRGRDRLGLSVRMGAPAMAVLREVAEGHRFWSPASDDLCYSIDLMLDGVLARHVDSARVTSRGVQSWVGLRGQRLRFEIGRIRASREYLRALLRARTPASLETACTLLTPPVALAGAFATLALGLAAVARAQTMGLAALGIAGLLALDVGVALLQTRARLRTWIAVAGAVWYLPWRVWVELRARAGADRRESGTPLLEPSPQMSPHAGQP